VSGEAHEKKEELPAIRAIQRVLIVDDSRLQRRILSSLLNREGYEVHEASSGQEGLELCDSIQPDLILSDWMMPEMDGLQFCEAFRAKGLEGYGYFILLTSKNEKEAIARGFESGADDFLTKPVNAHELRARMTAGERILLMQHELTEKNRVISETLNELQAIYESLDHDLVEAKKLQQSLVRERHKVFDTASVSLALRSSGHVGGDLVGHFPIGTDRLGLYSIDVSGHGISSALMTARLAGYLSSASTEQNIALSQEADGSITCLPPQQVVRQLNALFLNEMETEHYFTMLMADVDLNTGRVKMTQAGHPHPIVQTAAGEIASLGGGGFPVGLIEDATFTQFETVLAPGDRLIILSDGVTECPDPGGILFGDEELNHALKRLHPIKGEAFFETLLWELGEFADGNKFPDDISGVILEYAGPKLQ